MSAPLWTLVAGTSAASAVLLLGVPAARLRVRDGPARWPRVVVVGLASIVVAASALVLTGTRLVLALLVCAALTALAAGWQRGRRRAQADLVRVRVVELCEALVGELRAGRGSLEVLRRGAEVWPPFEEVARSHQLGADVSGALRRLARRPGAEGLQRLASGWEVSGRSGCPLSGVVDQVASSARADLASRRLVRSELASAQATARLVAVLPLATLSMGAGSGGHPWAFLLGTPAGLACLGVALALTVIGLWWIERIAAGVAT